MYAIIPRNVFSSLLFWGGGISVMARTFSESGLIPSLLMMCPKKGNLVEKKVHLGVLQPVGSLEEF